MLVQLTCCRSCKRFSKELAAEKAITHQLNNRVFAAEGALHFARLDLEQLQREQATVA